MHSIHFKGPNGTKGVIHHNGGWDGEAHVTWGPDNADHSADRWREVRVPGWLVKAMLQAEPEKEDAA